MNCVGRQSLGQVCFREIDVLHDGANVRNRQPPDPIEHGPQSVRSANPAPSAISQNLYAFFQVMFQMVPEEQPLDESDESILASARIRPFEL
jgi:hypothetical protein